MAKQILYSEDAREELISIMKKRYGKNYKK